MSSDKKEKSEFDPPPEFEAGPPPYAPPDQDSAEASTLLPPPPLLPSQPPPPPASGDDGLVQPAILVMGKLSVHAQTLEGPALYELSRDVRRSSEGETKVEFSRVDRVVRNGSSPNAAPRIMLRHRPLFDLKRLTPLLADGFPYRMEAASRHASGRYTIGTLSFPRSGVKIMRLADESSSSSGGDQGVVQVKGITGLSLRRSHRAPVAGVIFEAVHRRHGHSEWVDAADGSHRRIAVEDETADGELQLTVTAPLERAVVDALVASWCLRVWYNCVESRPKQKECKCLPFPLPPPRRRAFVCVLSFVVAFLLRREYILFHSHSHLSSCIAWIQSRC